MLYLSAAAAAQSSSMRSCADAQAAAAALQRCCGAQHGTLSSPQSWGGTASRSVTDENQRGHGKPARRFWSSGTFDFKRERERRASCISDHVDPRMNNPNAAAAKIQSFCSRASAFRAAAPPHLGVAVLASLGGGHLHDLAGSPLQQHKAVLAQGGALHGVGGGRPGIARLEVQVRVCHVCCVGGGERKRKPQSVYKNQSNHRNPPNA